MSDISEDVASRTRRVLRRSITAGLGTATLLAGLASPATAATGEVSLDLVHDLPDTVNPTPATTDTAQVRHPRPHRLTLA